MYHRRTKIIAFACTTRLAVIILQFIANVAIPDHDANVFLYPKESATSSLPDKIVNALLGGFVRWDAQYFMHIAKYGYTYENTLAFFPLCPLIVKAIATLVLQFPIFLNEDSVLLLTFTALNIFLFVKAALILYELGVVIIREDLAYKAAIFFCINPATIFFVAPYTECLFSYLSFKSMLNCTLMYGKHSTRPATGLDFKSIISIILPISMSTCTRSNGTLNIGFVAYFMIQQFIKSMRPQKTFHNQVIYCIKSALLVISTISLCLVPFVLVQIYDYFKFCKTFNHNLPDFIVHYAESNMFVLPGMVSQHKQSWCFKQLPLAYSYIQEHYWNVGFLKYFEIKQIPNFMIALPLILFVTINSIKFFMLHKEYCINLGIFRFRYNKLNQYTKQLSGNNFKPEMFVFIIHAVFLTLFCSLCIHVQVTTRMICSASPVVYWFAAYCFKNVSEKDNKFRNMFLFSKTKTKQHHYIIYYFLTYCCVGTVLFSNFLPWT